ncbi:PIG-X [Chytridium lagenaria]|nr:PIG-X [Chytridium lagenaria]
MRLLSSTSLLVLSLLTGAVQSDHLSAWPAAPRFQGPTIIRSIRFLVHKFKLPKGNRDDDALSSDISLTLSLDDQLFARRSGIYFLVNTNGTLASLPQTSFGTLAGESLCFTEPCFENAIDLTRAGKVSKNGAALFLPIKGLNQALQKNIMNLRTWLERIRKFKNSLKVGSDFGCYIDQKTEWVLSYLQLTQSEGFMTATFIAYSKETKSETSRIMCDTDPGGQEHSVSLFKFSGCKNYISSHCSFLAKETTVIDIKSFDDVIYTKTSAPIIRTSVPMSENLRITIEPLEGYHPIIKVDLSLPLLNTGETSDIGFILFLDQNAFADPFQLDGLNKNTQGITFFPFGEPDLEVSVESPTARFNGVIVRVKNAVSKIRKDKLSFEIPFHMRYQAPQEKLGNTPVSIPYPTAFLVEAGLPDTAFMDLVFETYLKPSTTNSPQIQLIHDISKKIHHEASTIHIPTGFINDINWVQSYTTAIAMSSALIVVVASLPRSTK